VIGALSYLTGFASHFESEMLPGALPAHNSPQRCPYGLYAEQISGTAFTVPRALNRRSWLYRIRPAVTHGSFTPVASPHFHNQFAHQPVSPDQLRWDPLPLAQAPTEFPDGLVTYAGTGGPSSHQGCAIHLYAVNRSMTRRAFYDADAELLLVPQQGRLLLHTELGRMQVSPCEIAVIPRGIRLRIELLDAQARGYLCENFGSPLRLPELGPIGANGLACERDFQTPTAWYEDSDGEYEVLAKFDGGLWSASLDHSPFDVVAWRGNHAPYKYDLRRFNTIGSVSFDHPDPSIFTVLQSLSAFTGVDDLAFVIFPPRWLAMEHTFRPPWFHRNVASEFMGLIHGAYDAKAEGFVPGGASLHNCMSGHGPDAQTFERASRADTSKPEHVADTMAFMFETRSVIRPTPEALESPWRQRNYQQCWQGIQKHFTPQQR
jgi:homogentisate 1,2-dioxygenase